MNVNPVGLLFGCAAVAPWVPIRQAVWRHGQVNRPGAAALMRHVWNKHEPGSARVSTILLIILIVLLLGALPTWPYSAHWGYFPSGGLGLILLIVIVLLVLGRI
jgi:hypothetical protein